MAEIDPVNEFVCRRVRELRLKRGLTIEQLARRAGIPPGSYGCLETGRYRLRLGILFRILASLGVSIGNVWPNLDELAPAERVTDEFVEAAVAAATNRLPKADTEEDFIRAVCQTFSVCRAKLCGPWALLTLPSHVVAELEVDPHC